MDNDYEYKRTLNKGDFALDASLFESSEIKPEERM